MRESVLIALLLLSLPASFVKPPQSNLIPGVVIEKVVVQSNPDQSYAAFLPSNYSHDRVWPAIFCFDPRARGKTAVERFVSAAERYGYVIVCSNNSRNGLDGDVATKIMTAFWQDVHLRLNIDPKRTYVAGFSGGARLTSSLAARCHGCVAGVLATGAGFPADLQPGSQTDFAYFGIVGIDDFNFGEMRALEKKFNELRVPYHFETFDGGHEWAPADSLAHALAWFSLQAMKTGAPAKDEKFIDEQLTTRVTHVERLLTARQFVEAYRSFLSIARDFQGLRDVKPFQAKADQLQKTAELRKDEQTDNELLRRQLQEAGEIRMLWLKTPVPDETPTSRQIARSRLDEWRKKGEAGTDSRDRRLARRVLSHLLVEAIEAAGSNTARNKEYTIAVANIELARAIRPKDPNLAYELARVHALDKEKRAALQALEEAVELGFRDAVRIRSEQAFAGLASDARFQKLILGLK